MVNGNYIVYGDRPSSESEFVDDHVQTRTAERKPKRKTNRTANELQSSLNIANQLDNETDSVKYEKKVKEPRLLRYVPNSEIEEHYIAEKFETYDVRPGIEERPRRYAFVKKPRNPADGSVNYGYSRSSSSSPNGNLPTISEHSDQFSTYRIRPQKHEAINSLDSKFDKYIIHSKEKKVKYDGSHPDSLYRVPTSAGVDSNKLLRVMKKLRWPAALVVVCAALGLFVYFLVPDSSNTHDILNSTTWESGAIISGDSAANIQKTVVSSKKKTLATSPKPRIHTSRSTSTSTSTVRSTSTTSDGTTKKPVEIDFYNPDKTFDVDSILFSPKLGKEIRPPVAPVFPDHITPEVQYGDKDKGRTPKVFDEENKLPEDSTLKPHITQKPEKPLAIYFKDYSPDVRAETISRAATKGFPDFKMLDKSPKTKEETEKTDLTIGDLLDPEIKTVAQRVPAPINFTSGHSMIFGLGIEDVTKMKITTQSSHYNTRVSPTLPSLRHSVETSTKKYPVNHNTDGPLCHSTRSEFCRGVLPYDLAGFPPNINGIDLIAELDLAQERSMNIKNCSHRIQEFICPLIEPECSPPPFPPKRPCSSLCKGIFADCYEAFPRTFDALFFCDQYAMRNCIGAAAPCHDDELACGDGTCVPDVVVCDGLRDCANGADEKNCQKDKYRCPTGGSYIQVSWLCDGIYDCPSGEDELPEECRKQGVTVLPHPTEAEPLEAGEAGEVGAGSAPAPSVSRYNSVVRESKTEDSSKELLITSDSGNALKRNFTRRPSPARLTPYRAAPMAKSVPSNPSDHYLSEASAPKESSQPSRPKQRPFTRKTTTTVRPVQIETTTESLSSEDEKEDLYDGYFKEDDAKILSESTEPSLIDLFEIDNDNKTLDDLTDLFEIDNDNKTLDDDFESLGIVDASELLRKIQADRRNRLRQPPVEMVREMVREEEDFKAAGGRSSPCPEGELRCIDGLCITFAQLCDGVVDCSDQADEKKCDT